MQLVEAEIDSFSKISVKLREMKVDRKKAMPVDREDAASVRTLISRLHSDTDMKFKTAKTDTGILVWRLK